MKKLKILNFNSLLAFVNLLNKKLKSLIKALATNDTFLLLEHRYYSSCTSRALVRPVNYSNVSDILSFQPAHYVKVFKNFLEQKDRGYYAYLDEKCVHRSWVKSNQQIVYPHWAYPMKLMPNQYFIHYCETAPHARGLGIYPAVLLEIVKDFSNKGQVLMSINKNNHSSLKGAKKAGFVERERVRIIIFLGVKFIKKTDYESC